MCESEDPRVNEAVKWEINKKKSKVDEGRVEGIRKKNRGVGGCCCKDERGSWICGRRQRDGSFRLEETNRPGKGVDRETVRPRRRHQYG